MPLRWHLPHGVAVAMSLAADGDLRDRSARTAWCISHGIPPPLVVQQVHGIGIRIDSDGPGDGLVAAGAQASLGVFGADCPPLVLAAPDALAVAHCGWRGTAAGIIPAVVTALAGRSAHPPSAWTALVGPGVHPDDYEVDEPVLAASWPAGTVLPGRPGRGWLDLPSAVAALAAAAGVGTVARSPLSTSRHPALRSHRRHGRGSPQLLVAWRTP